ncbi:MAG: amidophosphoribosyltransferase [Bacteroidia bacterium]|nr:amidophosphoribosyltransferase [Bacteroidia bacterium]
MTDAIRHECGIALVRLLKPLEYYHLKYHTWMYGLQKLYLLMEKQHNRGQDGAGVVNIKLDMAPGVNYMHRERTNQPEPIRDVFSKIYSHFNKIEHKSHDLVADPHWAKEHLPFAGELYLGHVRYGTYGKYGIENVHPVIRANNWSSRSLMLAGNFNLTNVDELFNKLVKLGQHPRDYSDTVTILEKIGHYLDNENQRLIHEGFVEPKELEHKIDIARILRESTRDFDGGYTIAGLVGHGDAFVLRVPWGIRPAFYYHDDEVAVVTSERPVIQTAFNVLCEDVKELQPGNALIIKKDGRITETNVREAQEKRSCSFERIYFSRGSDKDIYQERKKLGELLVPAIMESIDQDVDNTVFSYIPNTAEIAFYGMLKGVEYKMLKAEKEKIVSHWKDLSDEDLQEIVLKRPRVEKVAIKDAKLRTFIAQDKGRNDMVEHVYDITYDTIRKGTDNLVIIDDSIVRGTTLKQSILKILDRLEPKKIVIVSSAPQIRYPDCYGIDMARLSDFVAFNAAIELLKENKLQSVINEVYHKSKSQENLPKEKIVNYVKMIYQPFTYEQVSRKIAELLKPDGCKSEVCIVYQTVDNLHVACPGHTGDWYFTGNYPTPGGNKVVNTSYINYIEGKKERAY